MWCRPLTSCKLSWLCLTRLCELSSFPFSFTLTTHVILFKHFIHKIFSTTHSPKVFFSVIQKDWALTKWKVNEENSLLKSFGNQIQVSGLTFDIFANAPWWFSTVLVFKARATFSGFSGWVKTKQKPCGNFICNLQLHQKQQCLEPVYNDVLAVLFSFLNI